MNIAKYVRDPRLIKVHIPRRARLIKSKIEALALKEREHIVKKRIAIGKLYHRPDRNYQQMWLEPLVLLGQNQRLFGHQLGYRLAGRRR